MAHNDAYKLAEKKIAEAHKSGSKELDLNIAWVPLKTQELDEIPESLGLLVNLEVLKLSGNKLSALPKSIAQLKKLKVLDLSNNQLEKVPEGIVGLTSLQTLNLEDNAISVLPDWIGGFSELSEFNVFGNNISQVPVSLGELKKLKVIYMGGNPFKSVPSELRNLENLEWLDISRASLTSVPDWLSSLKRLYGLMLGVNWISSLPEAFCDFSELAHLNLDENELKRLPESFGRLSQLVELGISDNQLTELPTSIGGLKALESLAVSTNSLVALPEAIGELKRLTTLDVSNNLLTKLPNAIGGLKELESLDVSANGLTFLPDSIGKLKNLTTLEIANNRLVALPDSICAISSLQSLNLAGNAIKVLPDELGSLTELYGLDVRSNQLSNLPTSISNLKLLRVLYLAKNPLGPELAAVYEDGIDALKRYASAKAKAHVVLNEAKLIMIGEGEVGKSCLLAALRGEKWVENRNTTHGIEIKRVPLKHPETGATIILNGWDFGGQRVYRPTHQLFFTAPAVYLVVWKPREGPQQGFVKEWIKLVKHREPDAKIIIVATHGGPSDRQPDIDRQEIWDLFGKETVVDFFHVDSRPAKQQKKGKRTGERKGIKELQDAIARVAASLPEMGRLFPKPWQEAREALSKSDEPYLSLNRVVTICKEHSLDEDDTRLLLRICRRVGDVIHYEHDPTLHDIVVLKPDWLATAISFVLDDKHTRETGHGLVSFDRLRLLWNDPKRPKENRYTQKLHPIFLRLMERFDLSYRVAMGKAEAHAASLIAQLVPDVRPQDDLDREWPVVQQAGDEQQVQICRIVDVRGQSAAAEGLFYQLIVRLHKFSLGRENFTASVHWQRGLLLDDEYNGRALLEHVGHDVRITVRAAYPGNLLAVLTREVKWLVEDFWEGLKCEVVVPCTEPCGKRLPGTGLFEVEKLIDSKRRNRPEYPCPVCNEWQNIDGLLRNAPVARRPSIELLLAEGFGEMRARLEEVRQQNSVLDQNLRRIMSQVDDAFTGVMRTLTDEAKDGPRLFSLQPVDRSAFNPNGWVKKKFRVTLWCEHTRLPLPLVSKHENEGVYEFDVSREWFAKAAPFLKILTGTLSLVLPVAASAIKVGLDEAAYKALENQLDFGKECTESMLNAGEKSAEWLAERNGLGGGRAGVIRADGSVLREFQSWLKKEDPGFGDLRRVLNKRKEFLWVHRSFEMEY